MGKPGAQYKVAVLYQAGLGVDRDTALAAAYIRKAADQGWAEAQSSLSDLYAVGQDVPQDLELAVSWAAKQQNKGWLSPSTIWGTATKAARVSLRIMHRR